MSMLLLVPLILAGWLLLALLLGILVGKVIATGQTTARTTLHHGSHTVVRRPSSRRPAHGGHLRLHP
jgi:hypothetical protein